MGLVFVLRGFVIFFEYVRVGYHGDASGNVDGVLSVVRIGTCLGEIHGRGTIVVVGIWTGQFNEFLGFNNIAILNSCLYELVAIFREIDSEEEALFLACRGIYFFLRFPNDVTHDFGRLFRSTGMDDEVGAGIEHGPEIGIRTGSDNLVEGLEREGDGHV